MTTYTRTQLQPFFSELDALGKELRADRRPEDRAHFSRIEWAGRLLSLVGLATAWIAVNPLSIIALSLGSVIRWTVIAHHVLHGAFDKDPDAPARWKSARFGSGWRRVIDWLEWIPPDSWAYEHNSLHHYRLGEVHDPDVPEDVMDWLREMRLPRVLEILLVPVMAAMWKPIFYGPNTLRQVYRRELKQAPSAYTLFDFDSWLPWRPLGRRVWTRALLPVLIGRFLLLPLLFAPLGWGASLAVFGNLVLAELLSNLHAFLVIVPNHAGDDVFRFENPPQGRHEMLLRQVLGSVDYRTGGTINDVMHGYLNYQIEHHLWPDLAPLQLARAQPRVAELCQRHGIPYIQESVWVRLRALVRNVLGETSMQRVDGVFAEPVQSAKASK